MTEQEAEKAVKEDIEAIAKASDDREDKLTAMIVAFSNLLVNQTVHGRRSEKDLEICAMAGLIKILIDYNKLDEGTVYDMFVKLKMGKGTAELDGLFF